MKHRLLPKTFVLTSVLLLGFASLALASVTVGAGTTGTGISADKAANSTSGAGFTAVGTMTITEGSTGDFSSGSYKIVLNAPSGWNFQQTGVSASAQANGNMTVGTITATATSITINVSVNGTNKTDKLTITGVAVQATNGSKIPESGNITATATGTISGLTGTTNFGSLSQVAGAPTALYMSNISSPQYPGSSFSLTITGTDQYGNNANGTLNLTASTGVTSPTSVTLSNGTVTSNVSVSAGGLNETVTATSATSSIVSVTSDQFNVYQTSATDYFRSQGSGNWSSSSIWQSSHDSSFWFTATSAPTSGAKRVVIQNAVTISSNLTATNIVISAAGTLNVSSTLTLSKGTDTALYVMGVLDNSSTITQNTGATIGMEAASTYLHDQNGGTIPTAHWDLNSTCNVNGNLGTSISGLGQSFGNFTWSSTGYYFGSSLNGALTTVNGNLTFSGVYALFLNSSSSSTPTINVGGNFNITTGTVYFDDGSAGAVTMIVAGSVNITGGTLQPDYTSSTAAHIIKVGGNWKNSVSSTAFSAGYSTVIFNGSAAQSIGGTKSSSFYKLTVSNTSGNVSLGIATSVTGALAFTSGKLDASSFTLTYGPSSGNAGAITGVGANAYVITGNGSGSGKLTVNRIASGAAFTLPVGTATDYLPASITPSTANLNWSANVFSPASTNGVYGGAAFIGTGLAAIVNAVWIVEPSTASTTGTLVLNWTSDLEGSSFQGFANSNIGISHYTGSPASWQIAQALSASHSGHTVSQSFTSWSPFGIGAIGDPLPVTLINFRAVSGTNNSIDLTWQTTQEENSDYFGIERSADGINWSSIGSVAAQGNSDVITNYSFVDASALSNINYYRLKMVNRDATYSFSEVKVVTGISDASTFRIFPNPAKDYVSVTLNNIGSNSVLRLVNFSGQTVYTQQLSNNSGSTVTFPVQNLAQGTYMLQVVGADGSRQTGKLVIVR